MEGHSITSRKGYNLKQNIFFEDSDREKYLAILGRVKEGMIVSLPAYVLMDNHFHLLIETPRANLDQLMQNLNTSYAVFINRKYQRSGHLFQGRYKAVIVDKDMYLLALSRYIHLNPVRAGTVRLPEQYRWSSYGEYVGHRRIGLVNTWDTLSQFSGDPAKAVAQYKGFVESGIVGALSVRLDVTQGAVSQHLRILRDADLVVPERRGYYVHYRLNEKTLLKWKNAIEHFLGREDETEAFGNLGNIKRKGAMPCVRERSVARNRKN